MRFGPSPTRLRTLLGVVVLASALCSGQARAGGGPAETVVLVNAASEESTAVAEHFAELRELPPSHRLRVETETGLETTMERLTAEVVEPLRAFLAERPHVKFVVLTQGMPIRARTTKGSWVSTAAALSLAETALCGTVQERLPKVGNPYRSGPASQLPELAGGRVRLVTALISSTAEEAKALVDRSVASEGTAPEDALVIFQDARGNANVRNGQYDTVRKRLEARGFRTSHDPAGKEAVRDRKRVIGYVSGGSYSAMAVETLRTNEFLPGALCDMLQSFGAVPQNFGPDGKGGAQFPVTHLIRAGITGVHGAVAEPYTVAFPPADVFEPYYAGYTLAETFHQKIPTAYWMNLVIGDPLCAPYAERPDVTLELSEDGRLQAAAAGARTITAYLDGRPFATSDGANLDVSLPAVAVGDHHVVVQAVGGGAHEPVGWKTRTVRFGDASVPSEWPTRISSDGALEFEFVESQSDAPAIQVSGDDGPVEGTILGGGTRWTFQPTAKLVHGARLRMAIGTAWSRDASVAAAAIEVEAPAQVVAGDPVELRVALTDGSSPCAAWAGRLEVHSVSPPIRLTHRSTNDATTPLTLQPTQAGTLRLEVRAPDEGHVQAVELEVLPGPPAHATTPLSKVPVGQVVDLPVLIQDRHGNTVTDATGEVSVSLPNARHAQLPDTTPVRRGRATLRDLVLLERRQEPLHIIWEGKRVSQATEGIQGVSAAVRAWNVSTPLRGEAADALWSAEWIEAATRDGAAAGGAVFRRVRAGGDEIRFDATGTKDGDVAAAVARLKVVSPTKVHVRAAAAGRLRILVNGKEVFDGVPEQTNSARAAKEVGAIELEAGEHSLAVIAERKGRFGFRLRLADGKGEHPRPVTVLGDQAVDEGPRSASGRVTSGGSRGLAGVELVVRAGGESRTVRTDALGRWSVADLPAGPVTVEGTNGADLVPERRTADTSDRHVIGLDFERRDETPPELAHAPLPRRAKCSSKLSLAPTVSDSGGVASVRAFLGDHEIGPAATKAPFRLDLDVSGVDRGRHELFLVAVDRAGNETRISLGTVELVADDGPPRLRLSGIKDGKRLKRKANVTARVDDDIGVASIRFTLDGKPLGDVVTGEAQAKVSVVPDDLAAGEHVLTCTATDVDGNETTESLRFETR